MEARDKKLGVCLLTETFYPLTGGGETQARALCRGLAANDLAVTLLTRRTDKTLPKVSNMEGATIRRLGPTGAAHLKKWGLCFTALFELVRHRKQFDILLVCGYRVLGIPAILAGRLLGKPCFLKADSLGEYSGEFFDPGLKRFGISHRSWPVSLAIGIRNRLFRKAAGFIAISGAVQDELLKSGIPADRLHTIPNSVDVDFYRPANGDEKQLTRSRLGINKHRKVAVFTGRLVTTKGLPMLMQVWKRVVQSVPDALLLVVGSGGVGIQNCEAQLRSYVHQNGLEDTVRFTGSVENIRDYLHAADLFVFPSRKESFGISVAEAMACGLPVAASDIPGLSDVVVPGVTAHVFPPNNADALYQIVCSLLNDDSLREQMGSAGRQRAETHFAEGAIIDSYVKLIRQST